MTEIQFLRSIYENHDHFYVLNQKIALPKELKRVTYFISHSERDLKFFLNLVEAYFILRKERPSHIISSGAGLIVPFTLINILFFRSKVIYIESISRVRKPSLTGRIMYFLTDHFIYQWKTLKKFFPKGKYGGTLL